MTIREFLTNVSNGIVTDAEKEIALKEIAKMDAANEKRKNKTSPKDAAKQAEMAALREQIMGVLTNDPQIEADIAAQVGVSGPTARAQLRKLREAGAIVVTEIKVPKKGAVKGYSLPVAEATDAE